MSYSVHAASSLRSDNPWLSFWYELTFLSAFVIYNIRATFSISNGKTRLRSFYLCILNLIKLVDNMPTQCSYSSVLTSQQVRHVNVETKH